MVFMYNGRRREKLKVIFKLKVEKTKTYIREKLSNEEIVKIY